jgi:CspA family cold shock protein
MVTGILAWFDEGQDIGGLRPQYGGNEVCVHGSALRDCGLTSLRVGQRLQYEILHSAKGSSAVKITLL